MDADPQVTINTRAHISVIVSKITVLIMTRSISDSKLFSSRNVAATIALVGLVGAVAAFSNYDNVYALDATDTNVNVAVQSVKTVARTKANIRAKAAKKIKRIVAVQTPNKAFVSFDHKDESSFVLVNFDSRINSKEVSNSQAVQSRFDTNRNSISNRKPKILKVATTARVNKLKSNLSYTKSNSSRKITGLKLVAGGKKMRTNSQRYANGITGLQEVKFQKNELQFVAGISQHRLSKYMAKNCANSSFCDISNYGKLTSLSMPNTKSNMVEKIEISALPSFANVKSEAQSRASNNQFKNTQRKIAKTVLNQAISPSLIDEPRVIMLDETF